MFFKLQGSLIYDGDREFADEKWEATLSGPCYKTATAAAVKEILSRLHEASGEVQIQTPQRSRNKGGQEQISESQTTLQKPLSKNTFFSIKCLNFTLSHASRLSE